MAAAVGAAGAIALLTLAAGALVLLRIERLARGLQHPDDPEPGDDGGGGNMPPEPPRPSDSGGGDPAWWPEFERDLAAYVARAPTGARRA
jgi:hypothetical protein